MDVGLDHVACIVQKTQEIANDRSALRALPIRCVSFEQTKTAGNCTVGKDERRALDNPGHQGLLGAKSGHVSAILISRHLRQELLLVADGSNVLIGPQAVSQLPASTCPKRTFA